MSEAVGPVLDQSQRLMELECLVSEAPRGSADQWVLYETLARQALRAKGLEAAIEISDAMDSEFGIANWDLKVDLSSVRVLGRCRLRSPEEYSLVHSGSPSRLHWSCKPNLVNDCSGLPITLP